ncbi:MAG TPA: hypothetical protein VK571_05375 [Gemmatimonadaceae bacterium]|nr:hypothetical protein [Gemmatimonadaceae bacterium]
MKERPILFSGSMIPPLLDDTKTQTRRIATTRHPLSHIGPRGSEDDPSEWGYFFDGPAHNGYMVLGRGHNEQHNHGLVSIPCPYGEVGDHLWVRETWCLASEDSMEGAYHSDGRPRGPDSYEGGGKHFAFYRATDKDIVRSDGSQRPSGGDRSPWRPSIFMPRWASRIKLEVTEVRVQRLKAITVEDALAEGCTGTDPEPVAEGGLSLRIRGGKIAWVGALLPGVAISSAPCPRAHYATLWDSLNAKRASWGSNPFVWAVTFRRLP